AAAAGPATITAEQLVADNGGRLPLGIDLTRAPGPYSARWSETTARTVRIEGGMLLDAAQDQTRIVTISGGGLSSSRTF
ncbi:hypothetical protein, partial [Mesorhizobium japonicum]|uniref:hypothetical protein n=1 Tax=Mesorhizobium japonicum TaxID=2066070 RepID=UPI003B5B7180